MATLANLVVRITGNTASLNQAVSSAEGRLGKFKNGATKALGAVQKAAKGLAIGGAAAIGGFAIAGIKNFADLGDQLDKMSRRTGISVETLGELKFAAEQSGASLETVEKATKRMASTILDADMGLSTATDALDALGISVQQLQGLNPDAQFQLLASALSQVDNASTKAALAQDIFGKSGTELLPLFDAGARGMAALRKQARDLGVVMSTDAARSAADFKDAQNELKSALSGVFLSIGSELVPKLSEFIRLLIDKKPQIIAFFQGVKDGAAPFFSAFATGIGVVAPLIKDFFMFIFNHKPLLIAAIAAIGVAIATSLGPVSAAVVAITGIITLIGLLKDRLGTVKDAIVGAFQGVAGALKNALNAVIRGLNVALGTAGSLISGIKGALDKIPGPNPAGNFLNDVANRLHAGIPQLARGAHNFRGGLAVVGEQGPELVSLPRGSNVTPNNRMGNTYVFNFPNYVGNQDDLRRIINEARLEFERRGN